jgi:tRNA1Val (adenine37-N6)-methyltransferase
MITEYNLNEDCSRDSLYDGRLILMQPRNGYRFSIDSALLIWFSSTGRFARRSADLGAGCGVVGLGVLATGMTGKVVAIEVQSRLMALASRNAQLNDFSDSYEVIGMDIRRAYKDLKQGAFELVVSNPPFWPAYENRLPADEERQVACHEILGGIVDWVVAAARIVDPRRGRFCIVFPARRLDSLVIALEHSNLSCTRLRLVQPLANKAAELALVEARHGAPGRVVIEPPLVLKQNDGVDTPEVVAIMRGDFSLKLRERRDMREPQNN